MDILLLILLLLTGLVLGTLVNYLADVLPQYRKLTRPRCHHCEKERPLDDFLFLKHCRYCTQKEKIRSKIVFAAVPLLNVFLFFFNDPQINIWLSVLLVSYFVLVIVIDLEHRLILHSTSVFGLVLAATIGMLRVGFWSTFLGALAGFVIMFLFYLLGFVFIKMLNKRRDEPIDDVALGFGDVTLSTVLGALLGWPGIIGGLFVGILLGGLVSAIVLVVGFLNKQQKGLYALPYGPFLITSAFVLLYFI
ncbi:MAG: prepilin peptidase [Anaerolineae bacterium]|nr:prepilin peptidase [Anaerolineae bacterium]